MFQSRQELIVSQENGFKEDSPVVLEQAVEGAEVLQTSVKVGTAAQIVIAVIAVIGLIYLLKLVLVTSLVSMLLAYVLEPPVKGLTLLKVPRWIAALLVVVAAIAVLGAVLYFSFNSAVQFADQLPEYSSRLHGALAAVRDHTDRMEAQARSIVEPAQSGKKPIPVEIEEMPGVAGLISRNGETILDVVLGVGFVPFLVYFMLTLKDHSHVATVRLFPKEHRLLAHRTVGTISAMIRSYIVANVMLGALNSVLCALVFYFVGIKYFYFIGVVSGFAGLIPYLGVFVSLLPPLTAGIGILHRSGMISVIMALVVLHVITMNVLYPQFVGKRLRLNPLGVSLSLLFWTWIWGPPGLILAMPLLGAAKIICDHLEPLQGVGHWLGESLTSKST